MNQEPALDPRSAIGKTKQEVLKALAAKRIATVHIEYDGEGDSGQVESISAFTAKQRPVRLNRRFAAGGCSLQEALDDFAWEVLAAYHDGFVDNDGGFGTIIIDVAKGSLTIDHNDRVADFLNTVTEV